MDEDALLAWLGGKQYKKLTRHTKHKKLQDRADDDNGNDDKSSADYIPMESVSREYVKIKNNEDKKKLDKGIRESLKSQPRSEAKDEKRETKSQERLPESEDRPAKKADKKEVPKLKLPEKVEQQSKVHPVEPETTNSLAPKATAPVLPSTTPQQGILPPTTPQPIEVPTADKDLITEQVAADNEKFGNNNQQANPLVDPQSRAQSENSDRAPTARSIPSLANQLPPTEREPIADIPGGNGELKGVEVDDGSSSNSLPLQLDIPAAQEDEKRTSNPVLDDLSAEYRRAVSKPITLLGQPIDPASNAYEAADRAIAPLQLMNEGLLKLPTGMARLSNFINYPIDKLTGTDAFGKNNKMLDKADQFIDSFGVTRAPTNAAERAFTALGMLAVPNPATMLAPVAGAVGVAANEGVYQVAEAVKHRLQADPPMQNKYDELEPRVTSVDAATAKQIQQKVDLDKESFTKLFSQANYTDALLYTGGAMAAMYGLYKGGKFLKSPVAGRTILNPEKPIVEELPQSITTSKEVLRTINQDANYVLESQARKFSDLDLVHDISTSTRAGLAARTENMIETGAVNTPGYSTQLSASPKQLVEFHLQRPQQEQQDVSRAFHILDQADSAKLSAEKRAATKASEDGKIAKPLEAQPDYVAMPPEPDIQWANKLLAREENAGVVRMMREIREAKAKVAEASGRWDSETANNMLLKRPNYVHRVETQDSKIVDGKVVPKTRAEAMIDGLKSKSGQAGYINDGNAELSSALERSRVNAPNQMLDAVLANVDDLSKTSVFAHENDIVKRFYNGLKDHEGGTAIKTLKDGDKIPTGFESVTFYDGGKQVRFAVEPLTARALKFAPTSAASRYNLAATIRNAFQQATTGPILAPFFAPTSFAMEASIGAATRSRSLRVGNIDAALQAASGGKLAAPGDMFGAMAAGVGAIRRAQRADRILHATQKTEEYLLKYGNRGLQDLEAQMPGTTKKLARGLSVGQDTTLENILHQNRLNYEQTAKGWSLKNGALHSSQNEMMRNANRFYSGDVLKSFEGHFGAEEGAKWWEYWKGLVTNIHDAGRLALVEQNMGRVSDKQLAYEARKFSGDLGVRGAGNMETGYILSDDVKKAAQLGTRLATSKPVGSVLDAAYASIPYINPHIQGTTRFLEQLAKQPTTVIAAVAGSTMLPSLGSLGLSAALGPEYLDYLLNKREEYKKTGYIYIPVPGRPPQDGLDIRIDPVLSPFGYPIVEAMDSMFGIRQMVAQTREGGLAPNAEQQGIVSALQDGIKEAIGFGMPIQASLALASQSVAASRNIFEPSYNVRTEQASKLGAGKNTGSALSVPMQLILENVLGATAQHAIAGMDAYASTGKKESALYNATRGTAFSFFGKAPVFGTMLAGKSYNETGSVLAANTRKLTDAARRIEAGIQSSENILLKSANAKMAGGKAVDPVRMGNPGNVSLPPEIQNNLAEIKSNLVGNGRIKGINSERSAITTSLAGLRGVNAGNIGRHLLVPLKEGKEIGGLGYTILNEELVKQELAKEKDSIIHPKMTPTGKVSAQQRAHPLKHMIGDYPKIDKGKVASPAGEFYKAPSLKEVMALRNALNERRYTLDLQLADEYEGMQQALGINLVDAAKKVKLSNDVEASLSGEGD